MISKKLNTVTVSAILILAAFLRLYKLGQVPQGVTHDELGYIFNSYSIALTGKNVFSQSFPFLTWMVETGFPFLPTPIYFSAPIYWIFEISATSGRLSSAILGVIDIGLIYLITRRLFKNNKLAALSSLLLAISPWHLHFSRTAYDTNFSLFFYLLSILAFFVETKHKKIPVIASVSLFLALFSYRGMSAVFLPLSLVLLWYGIAVLKISKKQIVIYVSAIIISVVALLLVISKTEGRYTQEAQLFNTSEQKKELEIQIREAEGPLWLRRVFLNKYTYTFADIRENFLKAYSPEFLFLNSEPSQIYSIWSRGRIYFLDAIFLLTGLVYLFVKNKKSAIFVASMIVIGGLPGAVGGLPYSSRNFFLVPFFSIITAAGILFTLNLVKGNKAKAIVLVTISVLYTYSFASYLFDYYGRYAHQKAEHWAKSLHDVSEYAFINKTEYKNIHISPTTFGDVVQYALYSKLHPSQVQAVWKGRAEGEKETTFKVDNIIFSSSCVQEKHLNKEKESKNKEMYIVSVNCNTKATPSAQITDYPKNTIWKIYTVQ